MGRRHMRRTMERNSTRPPDPGEPPAWSLAPGTAPGWPAASATQRCDPPRAPPCCSHGYGAPAPAAGPAAPGVDLLDEALAAERARAARRGAPDPLAASGVQFKEASAGPGVWDLRAGACNPCPPCAPRLPRPCAARPALRCGAALAGLCTARPAGAGTARPPCIRPRPRLHPTTCPSFDRSCADPCRLDPCERRRRARGRRLCTHRPWRRLRGAASQGGGARPLQARAPQAPDWLSLPQRKAPGAGGAREGGRRGRGWGSGLAGFPHAHATTSAIPGGCLPAWSGDAPVTANAPATPSTHARPTPSACAAAHLGHEEQGRDAAQVWLVGQRLWSTGAVWRWCRPAWLEGSLMYSGGLLAAGRSKALGGSVRAGPLSLVKLGCRLWSLLSLGCRLLR